MSCVDVSVDASLKHEVAVFVWLYKFRWVWTLCFELLFSNSVTVVDSLRLTSENIPTGRYASSFYMAVFVGYV